MGSKSSKVIKTKQRPRTNSSSIVMTDQQSSSTLSDPQYCNLSSIYSDPCHLFSVATKKFVSVDFLKKLEGRVEIKDFIGGSQHLFVWLEDDPYENFIPNKEYIVNVKHNLYGTLENDYGQCSELTPNQKVKLDLKESDFLAKLKKDKDIIAKASNQVWTLKNVVTLCNYSFFHIITRGEYNMELVLGSGWNNVGCCSVGESTSSIAEARPVIFDIEGNHTLFLPEGQEITHICTGVSIICFVKISNDFKNCNYIFRAVTQLLSRKIFTQISNLSMDLEKLSVMLTMTMLPLHCSL